MQITFSNKKLHNKLTNHDELKKHYGYLSKKIKQRILEIEAAEHLKQLSGIAGLRFHALQGKYKNCFAIRLSGNYRMIIKPDNIPLEKIGEKGYEFEKITSIEISEIIDYH